MRKTTIVQRQDFFARRFIPYCHNNTYTTTSMRHKQPSIPRLCTHTQRTTSNETINHQPSTINHQPSTINTTSFHHLDHILFNTIHRILFHHILFHHNSTTTPPQLHHNSTTTTPPQLHHHNFTTTTPPPQLHHHNSTTTPPPKNLRLLVRLVC